MRKVLDTPQWQPYSAFSSRMRHAPKRVMCVCEGDAPLLACMAVSLIDPDLGMRRRPYRRGRSLATECGA
jgi:molybdopterin-guanine dinucleotide biosynthesis protein A